MASLPTRSRIAAAWHRAPTPLHWLIWCGVLSIIALIALPIVMTFDRVGIETTIAQANPGLPPDQMEFAWIASLAYTYILHFANVAVFVWLGWKILLGRRWAQVTLTVVLVSVICAAMISATAGSMYLWAVAIGHLAHSAGLALLWIPPTVRAYFRTEPSRPRPARTGTLGGSRPGPR
ncbi:hypothetical protein [Nocardia flavorosea]|uniref:Uncharacterized protein n=1 Tax=Nocardia flavorosea TaxID=53429 RepID=A0A846YE89_9NOCA|nr:hypothetical protein [Nocardia flavorosea]NKY56050.1 hypothetical protein [Nocardia flavorosea]